MRHMTRHTLALSGAALAALCLGGCAAGDGAAASHTPTPTNEAADPVEIDTSMSAACGQLSALLTVQENAREDKAAGRISDDAYRAQMNAVRFGVEQIPTIPEPRNSFGNAGAYLSSQGDSTFDPSATEWGEFVDKLGAECQAAGSPVGISRSHGG
jgi:hypothetical protein